MRVTIRHFLHNLVAIKKLPTILYPEQKRDYSGRFRGRPVLVKPCPAGRLRATTDTRQAVAAYLRGHALDVAA